MNSGWVRSSTCWAYVGIALLDTYVFYTHCLPWSQHREAALGLTILSAVWAIQVLALRSYLPEQITRWRVRFASPVWFGAITAAFALFALTHLPS